MSESHSPSSHIISPEKQKSHLRQQALERRSHVDDNTRQDAAARIARWIMSENLVPTDAVVAGYWPVKGELDVIPAMKALAEKGHVVCLPQIVEKGQPLLFREWREDMPMIKGSLGIGTPDPAVAALCTPDVLLVPMVAFDAVGNRLGYGAGYYDITIARLHARQPVRTIGVGFDIQRCESLPTQAHDRKMDIILTESGVYRYS